MTQQLRDIRRCALQALYQFDAGNAAAPALVRESLAGSPGDEHVHEKGFELATLAWEFREAADAAIVALTPEWPIYRQPIIDRNILRLAHYEMTSGRTPPKVAINEAVELAREFSTERSPTFVNGVLDKIYRSMRPDSDAGASLTDVGVDAADAADTASMEGVR
jgi:N utilization substance protein B